MSKAENFELHDVDWEGEEGIHDFDDDDDLKDDVDDDLKDGVGFPLRMAAISRVKRSPPGARQRIDELAEMKWLHDVTTDFDAYEI
jgi:hypothetical protein